MSFEVASNQIFTLLIILVIGFISKKLSIITDNVNKKLSIILLNITSPALIFTSFLKEYDQQKLITSGYIAIGAVISFIVTIILAEKVFFVFINKKDNKSMTVLKASAVFSNAGYMGFPLIYSVFGEGGVFYASIYVVMFQIVIWTYGVVIFSGEKDIKNLKKVLVSPALISVVIGMFVYIFQLSIPTPFVNASAMVGGMTTPLAMMIIGAIMANTKIKELLVDWKLYYATLIRLIIIPALAIIVFKLTPFPKEAAQIIITILAMPVAVSVAVFAERYDKESIFASKIVTISTFLSIITIPIVFMFL